MPLVRRDIKQFSSVYNASESDSLSDVSWRRGRFAQSDQVATCLLRRNYASAMPVRREMRTARNRRRLKFIFFAVCVWWAAGRILIAL